MTVDFFFLELTKDSDNNKCMIELTSIESISEAPRAYADLEGNRPKLSIVRTKTGRKWVVTENLDEILDRMRTLLGHR